MNHMNTGAAATSRPCQNGPEDDETPLIRRDVEANNRDIDRFFNWLEGVASNYMPSPDADGLDWRDVSKGSRLVAVLTDAKTNITAALRMGRDA